MYPRSRPSVISASTFPWIFAFPITIGCTPFFPFAPPAFFALPRDSDTRTERFAGRSTFAGFLLPPRAFCLFFCAIKNFRQCYIPRGDYPDPYTSFTGKPPNIFHLSGGKDERVT